MVPASGQTPRRHQGRLRTRVEPDGRARAQARMHVAIPGGPKGTARQASRKPDSLVPARHPHKGGGPSFAISGVAGTCNRNLTWSARGHPTSKPLKSDHDKQPHHGPQWATPQCRGKVPHRDARRVPGETMVGARERFPRQGPPWVCSNRSASRVVRHNKPRRPGLVPYPRPTATSGGVPQRGRRLRFMTAQLGPHTHTHTHSHSHSLTHIPHNARGA